MDLLTLSQQVGDALYSSGRMLVTAESCTGGWLGQVVTSIQGSSQWYERGFITYTNLSKQEMLGVSRQTLEQFGAVSEQAVTEMASGALIHSKGHISVAVSGIAGPGGGRLEKPVGTVCMAWAIKDQPPLTVTLHFQGNREEIRRKAVEAALQGVLDVLTSAK
jgi:nicotinamide-nucleotide amidase